MITKNSWEHTLKTVRGCTHCATNLPLEPRPIIQFHPNAKILIAAQAPGQRTHHKGIPFDDPSGDRLRQWLDVSREEFYNPELFAIVPMGFCFPGTGKSGDLPPRKECATLWREQLLAQLPNIELTLVIGQYAQAWHLKGQQKKNLTGTVKHWRDYWPLVYPCLTPAQETNCG